MTAISVILFLLLAVVLSDVLARTLVLALPFTIPTPLIQVAFGALIGLAPSLVVTVQPEILFLLLLPPLLFLDGWRMPSEELLKDRGVVIQLALGLVVFTVLGIGVFIHVLVPSMPLSVAFALAAVLSPTDPIAVSAIARRVPMPQRMMQILEGESLLNDASGLVCFKLALAAALTGTFSLAGAVANFAWVATAGVAAGVGLTLLLTWLKNTAARLLGEESGAQILISLLIPFGCYGLAERIGGSGVLAAVAGGLAMSVVESSGQASATTRIRRSTFWDLVRYTANGVIFVLLGEQLQDIGKTMFTGAADRGPYSLTRLVLDVVAITLALAVLRFVWVYVSLRLRLFRGKAHETLKTVPWRLVTVMSLAGVRGAITMAGVLSLPWLLPGGAMFPARELCIALAMGVIALSLVVAAVGLPLLLQGLELPAEATLEPEESAARVAAAHAAIAAVEAIEREQSCEHPDADLRTAAAARVLATYRERIDSRSGSAQSNEEARRSEGIEREMRLAALRAERDDIFRELRARRLGSRTARKLIHELDLLEARHTMRPG